MKRSNVLTLHDTFFGRPLTVNELDVLCLLAHGHTNYVIGRYRKTSEETVKTQLKVIYAKLGTRDRVSTVAQGYERGLIPLGTVSVPQPVYKPDGTG